ncbi:MAG: CCA tRNA nucleotidyltransferase [Alphaproteobacteria bacterium]|nr:CCA tRNA nucleotidyltransferase [Alphaproteobacteria bacterium]
MTDKLLRIEPQPWMVDPATLAVLEALAAGGMPARFVGGSVRDALLGRRIGDIDIATPEPPERVMELLEKRGIKVVPTGLAHGTVTAIAGTPPRHFEITTLRRDVETFGRRARVAFDADWAADAARRDFTINAIFLDPDGAVHDPVGGLADLRARRVRFVGDPATRIAEDVLRILRYYRFEARFGTGLGDPQARTACRAMAHRLPNLSAERVAQELVKLLETLDPVAALRMMVEDGVLSVILPEARRLDRLRHMIAIEPEPDPLRRLAALIEVDGAGAIALAGRLHFSNAWRDRLHGLAPPWAIDPPADTPAQRRAVYRLGAERYRDIALLSAAEGAMSRDRLGELLALARDWTAPAFPIDGQDVTALGIPPGPRIGRLLDAVRAWWEAGDFTADRAACLVHLKELVAAGMDLRG